MTLDEFEAGLDRWGGDLETWPESRRRVAMARLAASPEARRALEAMRAVEHALLRTSKQPLPQSDDLLARATALPQERAAGRVWRLRYVACAMLLATGFAYGALQPATPDDWFAPAFAFGEPFDVN